MRACLFAVLEVENLGGSICTTSLFDLAFDLATNLSEKLLRVSRNIGHLRLGPSYIHVFRVFANVFEQTNDGSLVKYDAYSISHFAL